MMLPAPCRMQPGWPAAKAAGMGSGFASRSDGVPDPVTSTIRGRAGTLHPYERGIITTLPPRHHARIPRPKAYRHTSPR